MSKQYPGGFITKSPVAPTTSAASGIWTLDQQLQAQKAGTWPSGANYIEDVFSIYLYTGNGSSQTITNGIDLAGKGGLNWTKDRSTTGNNGFIDTARGLTSFLRSNATSAAVSYTTTITSVSNNGYTLGNDSDYNTNAINYVSWTFREQPKFFDVVTYTGTGANRTIAHNLGSVPGCIIVKRTDTTADWQVYHRSLANTEYIVLNTQNAKATGATRWNSTTPTSTVFSLGTDATVNASGGTYVAYIYAHDAGGFGLTGTDNVVSCGTFTTDASGLATVNLGYEPQWIMFKRTVDTGLGGDWYIQNTASMWPVHGVGTYYLVANSTGAETFGSSVLTAPTSTGFVFNQNTAVFNSKNFIYVAIRRGPMKVPTSGTSVFGLNARTGTGANATVTGSAGVSDAVLIKNRGAAVGDLFASRLTNTTYLETSAATAQAGFDATVVQAVPWDVMDGFKVGTTSTITNASANTFINYLFDRAPSFFDVVCYTGTGVARTVAHNLAAVPELMIVKGRSDASAWQVYSSALANTEYLVLNTTAAKATGATRWNSTTPTSSVFSLGTATEVNTSASTYIAYLFATCAGVSKVGSYTGNGTGQTIDCGFTGGARFVMIKATSATGSWTVWDVARGITTGSDPSIALNSTAAESTGPGVSPANSGFDLTTSFNGAGATYIFLAIA